jgi:endoglucanase
MSLRTVLLFSGALAACHSSAMSTTPTSSDVSTSSVNTGFRRGVIVAHWLGRNFPEIPYEGHEYGAAWFDEEDVAWIAAHGFDHVAIEVDGRKWVTADGALDEGALAPVDRLLGWTEQHHLGVLLLVQYLPTETEAASPFASTAVQDAAVAFWTKVATRFAAVPAAALRFDPYALGAKDVAAGAPLQEKLVAAIRAASPERVVHLHAAGDRLSHLASVSLVDDRCVAVATFDEPMVFTWQGMDGLALPPVPFPGVVPDMSAAPEGHPGHGLTGTELSVAAIDAAFAAAATPDRPAYLTSFGVYQAAPADGRRAYVKAVRAAAERNGWGWAVYDYGSGMAVRTEAGEATPVMDGLEL